MNLLNYPTHWTIFFQNTDFCLQRVIILYEMRCGSLALVLGDYKMSKIKTSSYVWPQIHMRTLLIGLLTCMNLQATFDYMGQQGKYIIVCLYYSILNQSRLAVNIITYLL